MKNIPTFEDFINESENEVSYVFFYIDGGSLTNIRINKIFDATWKSKFVEEKLTRDWIVYVKKHRSKSDEETFVKSIIKKFPRYNSITYQAGVYKAGEMTLVDGSYVSYDYIEDYFKKTIQSLVDSF